MKKFAASLLALILCLGLCAAAISEDAATVQLDKNTLSGTSQVRLTVSIVDDFTVIIPASVTIDPETKTGTGTITLKAGYVFGADFRTMYVRLAGAENGIGRDSSSYLNFQLKSEKGTRCLYMLKADNAKYPFADPDVANLAVADYKTFNLITATSTEDNSADKTCVLTYTVDTLPVAGTYTDTLTFSIVTKE